MLFYLINKSVAIYTSGAVTEDSMGNQGQG